MFKASGSADEVRANLQAVEAHGAAAARTRIRRELLTWIKENTDHTWDGPQDLVSLDLREALDRICHEEG